MSGSISLSRLLVLASPSTTHVQAIRKIYNASLQAEGYPQATSQPLRRSTPCNTGFAGRKTPAPAEACSRGSQKADRQPQGHGFSVQGVEATASASGEQSSSPQTEQRCQGICKCSTEGRGSQGSSLRYWFEEARRTLHHKPQVALPSPTSRSGYKEGSSSPREERRPYHRCSTEQGSVPLISDPFPGAEDRHEILGFPRQAQCNCSESRQRLSHSHPRAR